MAAPFIADAIIQSEWGEAPLASFNNIFSLKCSDGWDGQIIHHESMKEYTKKKNSNITCDYRGYETLEDGVNDFFAHCTMYRSMKTIKTQKAMCATIADKLRATECEYNKKLLQLIEEYKLDKYNK